MTPKEREVVQQALEALDTAFSQTCSVGRAKDWKEIQEAITALREALAEQEKPLYRKVLREMLDAQEQTEQEPVAEALQIASVALQDIACSSQTENLYWWQLRARKAQKQIAECLTNAAPVEPAKQEPVAWAISHSLGLEFGSKYPMQETKEAAEQMARQHMGAVVVTPLYAAPVQQAEHEPVAYLCNGTRYKVQKLVGDVMICGLPDELIGEWVALVDATDGKHLRAAPVRTKDLTEDDIWELWASTNGFINFARAVIAKFKEKNRG